MSNKSITFSFFFFWEKKRIFLPNPLYFSQIIRLFLSRLRLRRRLQLKMTFDKTNESKDELPHPVSACVYRITVRFQSTRFDANCNVITRKTQCNAENACVNGMWQRAFVLSDLMKWWWWWVVGNRAASKQFRGNASFESNWHICHTWNNVKYRGSRFASLVS